MKKYRNILITVFMTLMTLICVSEASASDAWSVDAHDYRYDMSLYFRAVFGDDGDFDNDAYQIAAFAGEECRGVSEVLSLPDGSSILYMRIRSNAETGEKISFRYRDISTGEVKSVLNEELAFEANKRIGYPSDPYVMHIYENCEITFQPAEGGSYDLESGPYLKGSTITVTALPSEGHSFSEWEDGSTENPRSILVEEDMTVSALFTVNTYTLTYLLDGDTHNEFTVAYGTAITPEAAPKKEGYTFSGWDNLPETMPANDVVVNGSFTINSYQAVFKIGEEVIETQTVVYGESVTAPVAPEKEGHTFAGWQDVLETMPAHDVEILGSYTVNNYKLTYVVDGEPYKEYTVAYGTAITPEAAPEKEGYTFSGWDNLPETMPANDVVVNGSFTINSYQAVFKIGEDLIETQTVVYGESVTAPVAPEKEGHTFAGWQDVPETMPAHDIEILGSYTINSYKLTYMVDGETYKVVDVEYGTTIEAETPEKEGYTFSGWEGLPDTMPAHDVTVSGTFAINSYNAVFKIGEDIIETKVVVFGQPVVAPDVPAKEGHTFAGWQNLPETMPAHDLEILGSYTINSYKLTYIVDGETYKEVDVEFGTTIEAETAEKEGYTFSGWEGLPDTMPAHDVTVTGSFSINSYKLTVYLDDEIYMEAELEYGAKVEIPEPTIPEGKEFEGWQEEIPETMPAHDVEIHGMTKKVNGIFQILAEETEVTVYDINGNLIFKNIKYSEISERLAPGIYIINNRKINK